MNQMALDAIDNCDIMVDTRFCGTRTNPDITGGIMQITENNFTPQQLTGGFISGICSELYYYYEQIKKHIGENRRLLVGSGNGIRKNKALQSYIEKTFNMPLIIPENTEEAAFGATIFAELSHK